MVNQKDKLRQAAFNINNKIEGKLRVGSFSSITALWMPDVCLLYTSLPDNKAYKINFFIIAQAPKGVWALLILWGFCMSPAEAFALFGCSAI